MKPNKIILISLLLVSIVACKTRTDSVKATSNTDNNGILWLGETSLDAAKKQSSVAGKPIFVDVSAVWCGYCKKMKQGVYTAPSVAEALNAGFVSLALDGEKAAGKTLVAKLGINGYPTQLILNADGEVIKRNTGYLTAAELLSFLK